MTDLDAVLCELLTPPTEPVKSYGELAAEFKERGVPVPRGIAMLAAEEEARRS